MDSDDVVDVDEEVLAELREILKPDASTFVLLSKRDPRPNRTGQYYRCEQTFDRLTEWLRGQGVTSQKPIHELRKEFGSLVNQKHGIYAASRALRHSDITTSVRHYVASRGRVTAGMGHLLKTRPHRRYVPVHRSRMGGSERDGASRCGLWCPGVFDHGEDVGFIPSDLPSFSCGL